MDILKKLLNVKIALATVTNIASVLVLTGIIDTNIEGTVGKIATIIAATLLQLGIFTSGETK
jgi:ACT domain-containing protein